MQDDKSVTTEQYTIMATPSWRHQHILQAADSAGTTQLLLGSDLPLGLD
jgi:hypothetical protein